MTAPFTASAYAVTDEVKPPAAVSLGRSLSLGYKVLCVGFSSRLCSLPVIASRGLQGEHSPRVPKRNTTNPTKDCVSMGIVLSTRGSSEISAWQDGKGISNHSKER